MDDNLILEKIPLIYKVIKDMHCYWKTEDEFQSLYDAGLEGLIRGAKSYDESKGKTRENLSKKYNDLLELFSQSKRIDIY